MNFTRHINSFINKANMIIVEIGLNHLGSDKILSEFLKIPDNVDAVTIQIISDDFYNHQDYKILEHPLK